MKKTLVNRLSLLLVVMLVAASAFGCGNKTTETNQTPAQTEAAAPAETEAALAESEAAPVESEVAEAAEAEVTVLGDENAKYAFALTVVDKDQNTTAYEVHTDKENVGDALFELEFINDAAFFDTVNGMTASWDEDKAYWAVYVGEEYASVGVGEMTFTEGEQMELSFVYTAEE